ncbi:MAG: hypothetical protein LBE35_01195 [Clostridiales bacterium]|jgi:hypothetical protein|nr:hypothetical protein [Clostridiales bacterium]
MQAIQGYYDNGVIEFIQEVPLRRFRFVMHLVDDDRQTEPLFVAEEPIFEMSKEESMRIFHKYSGSISREIDIEKERDEYLYEKYGPFN